jgi:hypothetical protein
MGRAGQRTGGVDGAAPAALAGPAPVLHHHRDPSRHPPPSPDLARSTEGTRDGEPERADSGNRARGERRASLPQGKQIMRRLGRATLAIKSVPAVSSGDDQRMCLHVAHMGEYPISEQVFS